jgi:hypothetical protein
MPRLNVFCTCERIIIDTKGIPSLISLFQRMNIQQLATPFAEDAVVPARWVIFCLWQFTSDEVGQEFVQKLKVIRPNGAVVYEGEQPFQIQADSDLHIRTYGEMNGLHIGQEGNFRIQVWLAGHEDDVHECTFFIKHIPPLEPEIAVEEAGEAT